MPPLLAPVKINLCLHVGPQRPDGLHALASLAAILPLGDLIEISPASQLSVEIDGPFADDLLGTNREDNLVMRAARALQAAGGITAGAHIRLTKNMPVASGLGAGTADATATLVLLHDYWQIGISNADLFRLAFQLGADGPLCLLPHLQACISVIVAGAGEQVSCGPALPQAWVCLVNPGKAVSTAQIFAQYDLAVSAETIDMPELAPGIGGLTRFMGDTRNDLQDAATSLCPQIGEVIELLTQSQGCFSARMSGSGATCFGLFASRAEAEAAARAAAQQGWWQSVTPLGIAPEAHANQAKGEPFEY